MAVLLKPQYKEKSPCDDTLEKVAEDFGLTAEGVRYALSQYQKILCEITHGMLSKLSYDANDVIRYAQDKWCETCEIAERLRMIDNAPTADVQEVKHAHWYSPVSSDPCEWCSNCQVRTRWAFDEGYCPNCGEMDGDNNGEDNSC